MDGPEIIMLSEISQRKASTVCFHLYVESKQKKTNEHNKTETDSQMQRANQWLSVEKGVGEGARQRKEIQKYKLLGLN